MVKIKKIEEVINLLRNKWFWLKLKKASPSDKAELMRDKFYFCGQNIKLYTHQ